MRGSKKKLQKLEVLKSILTSPFYILLLVAGSVFYYELFRYLIIISNSGIFFVTVPLYLVYALVLSASLLFTTSVYAISKSVHAKYAGVGGSMLSVVSATLGDLVVGCSCYAPILSSVMYAIGFGALQVSSAISFLGDYQASFVVVFVAVNLIFIYYQLGRITRIGGIATGR